MEPPGLLQLLCFACTSLSFTLSARIWSIKLLKSFVVGLTLLKYLHIWRTVKQSALKVSAVEAELILTCWCALSYSQQFLSDFLATTTMSQQAAIAGVYICLQRLCLAVSSTQAPKPRCNIHLLFLISILSRLPADRQLCSCCEHDWQTLPGGARTSVFQRATFSELVACTDRQPQSAVCYLSGVKQTAHLS